MTRKEDDPKAKVYGPGGEEEVNVDSVTTEGDQVKINEEVSEGPGACDKYKKGDNLAPNSKACIEYKGHKETEKNDPCYQYKNGSKKCPPGMELNPGGATAGDRSTCCKEKDKKTCPDGSPVPADGQCKETKKTPGYEGDLYKQKQSTVKQPWQVRQQNRAVKKSNRDIRRSEIKLSKLGTRNADGTYTMNEGLSARKQAKFRENLRELESFQNQASNIGNDVKTGKIAGETYISGQEKMNQADLGGVDAQREMLKNKREFEQANTNKIVQSKTKQADKAVTVDDTPNSFDAVASNINSTPDFQNSVNTDFGQYKFGNYSPKFGTGVVSGFFKKAKPLSKNYFANRKK